MNDPVADPQKNDRPSFQPKWLPVAVMASLLTLAFLLNAAWWIGGPIISAKTLKGLRGATREDVRKILGNPSEIQDSGTWIYARRSNPGWVAISFNDEGIVQGVNDEQAAPDLFGSGSW